MSDLDDFELLGRWRAGDQGAADALVRRYYGAVLRFFEVRTRQAEDLTQRTFLACVEGQERFRGDASFRAYLFGIARRQLFRHIESERRADRLASLDEPEPQPGTSLSVLVARREEHQILLTALSGLPEEIQTVIVLHYWEGLLAREIAEVLEVATSTITTRLQRARQALGDRIRRVSRRGRASDAVLADLDGWVRSLADPAAMQALLPQLPQLVARRRRP
ncbi:MAG: sigma-70 family RNA polymerase sigma factor [Myxococcales bacterium]|nr:sigma-70 family RNA polymerase sigma factor [Myxococcales bacterium]